MTVVLDAEAVHGRTGASALAAVERADRERQAFALRQRGWTFAAIAVELGYGDRSAAHKAAERGELRWMRETDAGRRAGELARIDVLLALLWPSVCAADPKSMDQAIRLVSLHARIMGLFGKPVETPDTYAVAHNGAEPGKAYKVERYIELIDEMMDGVIEASYGSGIRRPGDADQDNDAVASQPPTAAIIDMNDDGQDDRIAAGNVLPDGCSWYEGKPVPGQWTDGKFVKSIEHASDDDDAASYPCRPRTTTNEHTSADLRAEAFNVAS